MLAACQTPPPNVDQMVGLFDQMASGPESYEYRIHRWPLIRKIRVRLQGKDGENPEKYRAEVKALLNRLSILMKIEFRILPEDKIEYHHIKIILEPVSTVDDELDAWCITSKWRSPSGKFEFHYVEIRIGTLPGTFEANSPRERVKFCIGHEAIHAIGLSGHPWSPDIPSVMIKYGEASHDMTPWDELVVRALYDPRLKIGMTQEEAAPIVRRIMAERLTLKLE
jgi:hypothetical protein